MSSIRDSLKRLNKLDESDHKWEVVDQDDVLDPWVNDKKLHEGISSADWSSIVPCDILYCETSVQHFGESPKRRPLLVIYKSGSNDSPNVYGMQVTTVGPTDGFRAKFRYKLQDWRNIGLRQQSYVNYDHLVQNETDDVRKYAGLSITKRDAKGLLEDIKKNYNDLIRLGYRSSRDKELLDDFINYLESM